MSLKHGRAFTLIELLVVVLIIAILAAVAVPQYQRAVRKAQFANLRAAAESFARTVHMYYLSQGDWPHVFDDLDAVAPEDMASVRVNSLRRCVQKDSFFCCMSYPAQSGSYGAVSCGTGDESLVYSHRFASDAGKPLKKPGRRCAEKTEGKNFCQTLPGATINNSNTNILTPQGIKWGYTAYDIN